MAVVLASLGAASDRSPRPWWSTGHAVVCDIAWRELSPVARQRVAALLALDPDYDELGPACEWADVVGGTPEYAVYRLTHYANLPRGASGYDAARDCGGTLCVVEAIQLFASRLGDPSASDAEKLEALKFVGHLVGDIHQPLHMGYAEDRGGNTFHVCVPGRDSTNLHSLWDGLIIARRLAETGLDWKTYGERLQAAIHPVDRARWSDLDPKIWADESFALVEDEVYEGLDGGCVADAFYAQHMFTVERRLKQAGYRLGALLNEILSAS